MASQQDDLKSIRAIIIEIYENQQILRVGHAEHLHVIIGFSKRFAHQGIVHS